VTRKQAEARVVAYKCQCDICIIWMPLQRRILKKLKGKDLELFEQWRMRWAMQSDDLGAAEAKLAGDWPGWEWMKQAVKDHAGWASD
jgi:hypothetical protein